MINAIIVDDEPLALEVLETYISQIPDIKLIKKCEKILINITKFGWDEKYGGIFYFKDIKGCPLQQLEWDQKLWWVHIETMISFLKAYKWTGNPESK